MDPEFAACLSQFIQAFFKSQMAFAKNLEVAGNVYLYIDKQTRVNYILEEYVERDGEEGIIASSRTFQVSPPMDEFRRRGQMKPDNSYRNYAYYASNSVQYESPKQTVNMEAVNHHEMLNDVVVTERNMIQSQSCRVQESPHLEDVLSNSHHDEDECTQPNGRNNNWQNGENEASSDDDIIFIKEENVSCHNYNHSTSQGKTTYKREIEIVSTPYPHHPSAKNEWINN